MTIAEAVPEADKSTFSLASRQSDVDMDAQTSLPMEQTIGTQGDQAQGDKSTDHGSNNLPSSSEQQPVFQHDNFSKFPELPKELRLEIWQHAIEDYTTPRVHIITKKRGQFISNQDISPLLSTCSESRGLFQSLGFQFGFGTYVKFDTDVIYIRPFSNSGGNGPWYAYGGGMLARHRQNLEDEIVTKGAAGNEQCTQAAPVTFQSFLEDKSTKNIRRLAMTVDFFLYTPVAYKKLELHSLMREKMPLWTETLLVHNDTREQGLAWKDTNVSFRDCPHREGQDNSVGPRPVSDLGFTIYREDRAAPIKFHFVNMESRLDDAHGTDKTVSDPSYYLSTPEEFAFRLVINGMSQESE
jgi:hypothetical protein